MFQREQPSNSPWDTATQGGPGGKSQLCVHGRWGAGFELQSGPLRWGGGKEPFQASRHREEKSKESRGCRGQVPSCTKTCSSTFPSGQTTELGPTSSQPTLQQHQGAAWESCSTRAHTQPGGQQDNPPLSPFPSLFPKRDCPARWSSIPTTPEPRTATLAHKLLH